MIKSQLGLVCLCVFCVLNEWSCTLFEYQKTMWYGYTNPYIIRYGYTNPYIIRYGYTNPYIIRYDNTNPYIIRYDYTNPYIIRYDYTNPYIIRYDNTNPYIIIRYGYLDGLDDVDLSLSGLIGSSKQVERRSLDFYVKTPTLFIPIILGQFAGSLSDAVCAFQSFYGLQVPSLIFCRFVLQTEQINTNDTIL